MKEDISPLLHYIVLMFVKQRNQQESRSWEKIPIYPKVNELRKEQTSYLYYNYIFTIFCRFPFVEIDRVFDIPSSSRIFSIGRALYCLNTYIYNLWISLKTWLNNKIMININK